MENKRKKSVLIYKICGWTLLLIAILIPALIAGMKNLDVGYDIAVVKGPVDSVVSHNYNFVDYMTDDVDLGGGLSRNLDLGFKALIYALTLISSDINFIMFALQFMIMLFVALFAYKLRDITNMTFVMLIYMIFWYYLSFTLMRQSLAMAILFFSVALFWKKEYVWAFIWFLIAALIHSTSLLGIVIFALIALSRSRLKEKYKSILFGLYAGIVILFGMLFDPIVNILVNVFHIVPEQFLIYLVNAPHAEGWMFLVISACFIVAAIVYMIKGKNNRVDGRLILALLITDFITQILSFRSEFIDRIGFYFGFLALFLLIPNLPLVTKNTLKRIAIVAVSVLLLFTVFYRRVAIQNIANMYPYRSDILHLSVIDKESNTS